MILILDGEKGVPTLDGGGGNIIGGGVVPTLDWKRVYLPWTWGEGVSTLGRGGGTYVE